MRKNTLYHYEILDDGNLLMIPMVRSMRDVLLERTKVAQWFSKSDDAKVLMGSIPLGSVPLEEIDNNPTSLLLQEKIDVFNEITAEEVIADYQKTAP